jgi:PD-(D/E)XK nuclease superfamily
MENKSMTGDQVTDIDKLLVEVDSVRTKADIKDFEQLLATANEYFRQESDLQALVRDPRAQHFNIFRLTSRADYEVTTHQRVLADLLNPLGTHGQGNFFLEPFLSLVTERTAIELPPPNALWEVDQKNYIDVRLQYPDTNHRVIIEVKWNAPERERQVLDTGRTRRDVSPPIAFQLSF